MRDPGIRANHSRPLPDPESGAVAQPRVLFLTDDLAETEVHSFALRRKHIQAMAIRLNEFGSASDVPSLCDLVVFELNQANSDLPCKVREIATHFSGPLLLVTYERDERYQLKAYDAGVAECITKPIGVNLLQAKILAWLKQSDHVDRSRKNYSKAAGFRLYSTRRLVHTPEGNIVKLSDLEFRLLQLLIGSQGRILDSSLLTEQLWTDYDRDNGTLLKSLVYRARQKIEADPTDPHYIVTVPGHGYMFSSSG